MNKNNLKKITVFMAMMAALTQVKAKAHMMHMMLYEGLFEEPVRPNRPRILKFVKKKSLIKIPKLWCRQLLAVQYF